MIHTTNAKSKLKSILLLALILFVLTLLPFVAANPKPITSTLIYPNNQPFILPITVHVLATGTGTPQECITNPEVYTGAKGSFATNLDNLVIKSAPTLRCSGLWKIGDSIWYTTTLNHQEQSTLPDVIKSGTGLQVLVPLEVQGTPQDNSSSSRSPINSANQDSAAMDHQNVPPPAQTPNASLIELQLNSTPIDQLLHVSVTGKVISGSITRSTLRIELRELPDHKIIDFKEFEVIYPSATDATFDISQINSGLYQVQAIALEDGKIIAASAPDTFTLRKPEQEIKGKSNFGGMAISFQSSASNFFNSPYVAIGSYAISFVLILSALLLFIYKKRHYATPIPVEILGEEKNKPKLSK